MGKKIIRFGLSTSEIDRAIKELEQYKRDIIQKTELLRKKVAERIESLVASGFASAIVDDLTGDSGGVRHAEVEVSVDEKENVSIIIAKGEDAVWVEFGAGVYHNGSAGSSPHPKGAELGFAIGEYGKGMGKRQTWGYYEDGELRLTHGTPAAMPMYNAMKNVCQEIDAIAREVFK